MRKFEQRREYREKHALLDLAEPIRSLWIEGLVDSWKVGDTWSGSEPLRALADLFLVPASSTYTVLAIPDKPDGALILSRRLSTSSQARVSIPPRIGYAVPDNLRVDALGPNLFALPPSARFENWIVDSTETIRYRPDWRLPEEKKGNATISFEASLPRVDGPRRYGRSCKLSRNWSITVRPTRDIELGTDARYLLLGGRANGVGPLESVEEIE